MGVLLFSTLVWVHLRIISLRSCPYNTQLLVLFCQQKCEKKRLLVFILPVVSEMDPMDGGMRYAPGSKVRFTRTLPY